MYFIEMMNLERHTCAWGANTLLNMDTSPIPFTIDREEINEVLQDIASSAGDGESNQEGDQLEAHGEWALQNGTHEQSHYDAKNDITLTQQYDESHFDDGLRINGHPIERHELEKVEEEEEDDEDDPLEYSDVLESTPTLDQEDATIPEYYQEDYEATNEDEKLSEKEDDDEAPLEPPSPESTPPSPSPSPSSPHTPTSLFSPSTPTSARAGLPPFSLWDYLKEELSAVENNDVQELKTERVTNFLVVPRAIETIMMFGYFVCLDSFLYAFTILPIRFSQALYQLVASVVSSFTVGKASHPLKLSQKCDLLKGMLVILSSVLLAQVDASQMYHNIKGQAVIKLYVIFNVLEILDRLCCSFGQDLLDSLFSKSTLGRREDGTRRHLRPFAFFSLALLYVLLHTLVLFYQVITLNVAINSYSSALLTLLLSNQFVEIKGSVFKKFEKENLFQLTCADIVERFQLSLFLFIICIRDIIELSESTFAALPNSFFSFIPSATALNRILTPLTPVVMVLASEMLVDWLKHAFITKFNHIRPTVYGKYMDILCQDMAVGGRETLVNGRPQRYVDQSPAVARRIGFAALPLACLAIRVSIQTIGILLESSPSETFVYVTPNATTSLDIASPTSMSRSRQIVGDVVGVLFGFGSRGEEDSSPGWESVIFPWIVWTLVGCIAWACLVTLKLLIGINLISYAHKRHAASIREAQVSRTKETATMKEFSSMSPREQAYNANVKAFLSDPTDDILGQPRHRTLETIDRFTMVKGRIW